MTRLFTISLSLFVGLAFSTTTINAQRAGSASSTGPMPAVPAQVPTTNNTPRLLPTGESDTDVSATAAVTPAKGATQLKNKSGAPETSSNRTPTAAAPTAIESPAPLQNRIEKYLLQYKFAKGEVLRTKVTQQTRVDTTIGGSNNVAEVATLSQKSWRVIEVDKDGAVTFETMWEKIDMRQKMSGREEIRYNSDTDKSPPAGYEATAASIGVPLSHLTISANGKFLKREIKLDSAKQFMDDKASYQSTQQLLVPLPTEAVVLGQPWSIPVDINVKLDSGSRGIQARHRYKIDKVEKGIATISCETILPPINDPEIRSQLIQQMGSTKIEFDIARGKVLSHVTDVDERVIGFRGADSSIHFLSRFTETILDNNSTKPATPAPVAAKPTTQQTQPAKSAQVAPPVAKQPVQAVAKPATAAVQRQPAPVAQQRTVQPKAAAKVPNQLPRK